MVEELNSVQFSQPLQPLQPQRPEAGRLTGTKPGQLAGKGGFKQMLMQALEEVNSLQAEADKAYYAWQSGRTQNFSEMMTAVQKADLAFKTLMQIRNKLLDAYQQLQQMRL